MTQLLRLFCFFLFLPILTWSLVQKRTLESESGNLKGTKDGIYLFGVGGTRAPYNFENEDGKLVGFDVDIVNAVCTIAKKKCYTVLRQKEDCIFTDRNIDYAGEGLMSEAIQGCAGYQITTDRLNEFAFTLPYLKGKSTYAVLPQNAKKFDPSSADFTNFKLVQASGSPFNAACLTREGKKFGPILVASTVDEAKQFLSNGTAEVLLSTRETIKGLQVLPTVVHCDDGRGTGMLLKQGSAVSQWWNQAFREFYQSKGYFRLCKVAEKKFNASINCLPNDKETRLMMDDDQNTKRTQDAIQHTPSRLWSFVVSGRIAPYSFINTSGELVGFTKDLIMNVCKIAGKKCVLLLSEVSECSVRVGELLYPGRGLTSGWFDACTGYFSTVDRRNSWDFSDPYLVSNASFYVAPGNPSNFNPAQTDLSFSTIVYQAGAITTDHCLHRLHKKVGKLLVVDNEDQAAKAVLSGKADAWFTKLIVPQGQGLLRLSGRFHCEHVGTSIMVRKGSDLPTWWNKAFRHFLKSGKFHQFCQDQGKMYQNNFPCVSGTHEDDNLSSIM